MKHLILSITLVLLTLTHNLVAPVLAQDGDSEAFLPEELADEGGQFIDINGDTLYYLDEGNADAQTVILLHGFGGSTFTWRDTLPVLVEAGYRVIAYDRPPFGLSEKSREITLSSTGQADQLAALMDALDIDSATVVGHSAGGGVISYFAVQYPERVDALVFVAGAVPIPDTEAPAEATAEPGSESPIGGLFEVAANLDTENPAVGRLVRTLLTEDRFIGILQSAYNPDFIVTDEIAEGYSRILRVENWEEGFLALLTSNPQDEPLDIDALASVGASVPTLILWGEADTWVPLEREEALAALIPSATLITYPGIGHLPMEENTETFNRDLVEFLTAQVED